MKGIAYYCFTHDQGCLIISRDIPKKINKACSNCKNCSWEDVGSFYIEKRKLHLHVPNSTWFDEMDGCWKVTDFKKNIFTKSMDWLDYHELIDEEHQTIN